MDNGAVLLCDSLMFFFFKQKTAYEMRISDWSSDVCSSDLGIHTSGQRKIENRLDAQRSGKANFDSFAPKFGMLLEPADDVQVYANYSRSVELPGFSEL